MLYFGALVADLHAQVGDADACAGESPERRQAAPVPALRQELLLQPPARPARPRPYGWAESFYFRLKI